MPTYDRFKLALSPTPHPRPLGQPLTGSAAGVNSVAFSPDGHTVASGSGDGTIRLWSLPQTVLTGATAATYSVAFSPDRHTLASGSNDAAVRLWDLTSSTPSNGSALQPEAPRPGSGFGVRMSKSQC